MFAIDPDTLNRSKRGVITGAIYLDLEITFFPGQGWTDFAPEIVAWWLDPVERLWYQPDSVAKCLFKDGPYEFRLSQAAKGYWKVECITRGVAADSVEYVHSVKREECLLSLCKAARELAAACRERGWTGGYEQYLESRATELARLLAV